MEIVDRLSSQYMDQGLLPKYQGIHKGKSKFARNEKRKKLRGFSYT